jgi:hypothetical protein
MLRDRKRPFRKAVRLESLLRIKSDEPSPAEMKQL